MSKLQEQLAERKLARKKERALARLLATERSRRKARLKRAPSRALREADIRAAKRMEAAGATVKQRAEALGVCPNTLYHYEWIYHDQVN